MTYYNIVVYMYNGKLYHNPPGEVVIVLMDEQHNYYYHNGVGVKVY